MGVGVPLTGKTTFFKNHRPYNYLERVSSDDLIDQIAAILGMTYSYIFPDVVDLTTEAAENKAKDLIKSNRTFVWDQTNLTVKARKKRLDMAPDFKKVAIVFVVPLDILLRREKERSLMTGKSIPGDVLDKMLKMFQYPTKEEGFDEVISRGIEEIVQSKAA